MRVKYQDAPVLTSLFACVISDPSRGACLLARHRGEYRRAGTSPGPPQLLHIQSLRLPNLLLAPAPLLHRTMLILIFTVELSVKKMMSHAIILRPLFPWGTGATYTRAFLLCNTMSKVWAWEGRAYMQKSLRVYPSVSLPVTGRWSSGRADSWLPHASRSSLRVGQSRSLVETAD